MSPVVPPYAGRRTWGNPWLGTLARLVLAAVLLYAGLAKLFAPQGARDAILAYRIFPASWADALGWGLPVLEVLLGIALLAGLFTRLAAAVTAVLMIGFVAGIVSVWVRGYSIDCGCFGGGGDVATDGLVWRYTSEIARDLLFLGLACWLVAWPRTRLSLAGPGQPVTGEPAAEHAEAVSA
ncbi:MAG: DoxX family membrane protein [Actinomycetota bacterium]|nr:MAG: DoxX family membrane protein [Actinomycetota bacterium]